MEATKPFTELDLQRFKRHFRLPGFGIENQQRLQESAVIIVGMGGLGNVVAGQLAAAGIGRLTLVDFDTITLSNLSRQLLYTESDLGLYKTAVASERLQKQFPNTLFNQELTTFDSTSGEKLCRGHHLIIDCCDTRTAKYSIDEVAATMRIPLVFGAVSRFDGQVSVFHGQCSTSYAHVFPKEQGLQDEGCDALGVWAPAVGIIGSIMAQEALAMLAFGTTELDGTMLQVDLKRYQFSTFKITTAPLEQLPTFPGLPSSIHPIREPEIPRLKSAENRVLCVQIREQGEPDFAAFDFCLSMNELIWRAAEWEKERPVLLQCSTGKRSLEAALLLSGQGFQKTYPVVRSA